MGRHWLLLTTCVAAARGASISSSGTPPAGLADGLAAVVDGAGGLYNTSFSVGVVGSTFELGVAGGIQDHGTGALADVHTKIPSGSVTKPWTAMRVMQLMEAGKIDINAPAHTFIDPWLAKQGKPSLKTMWAGDSTIETVTVKQLMAMESGLGDYNDAQLQAWTIANPDGDYSPFDYIGNLSKRFLFPPGKGAAYSSDGFVLLGMVLCSVTGVGTWSELDQLAVVDATRDLYSNDTIFMHTGKCSAYSGVAHQYLLSPPTAYSAHNVPTRLEGVPAIPSLASLIAETELALADTRLILNSSSAPGGGHSSDPTAPHSQDACGDKTGWKDDVTFGGRAIGLKFTATSAECCAEANRAPYTYYPDIGWTHHIGFCTIYYGISKSPTKPTKGATSAAVISPHPDASWFKDLYVDSCLNGWTMGNIASSALNLARFFHSFSAGKLVNQSTVDMMMPNHVLTQGFAACGTPNTPENCLNYGLGTIAYPYAYGVDGPCTHAGCKCAGSKCSFSMRGTGHPGQDWGSGMPTAAFFPVLGNVTVTLGLTASSGMNSSMTIGENYGFQSAVPCYVFQALFKALGGGLPALDCSSH